MKDEKGANMNTEITPSGKEKPEVQVKVQGSSEAVYAFGLIGAWVYYIGRAVTPREKVIGFFKGFAWPAFVVHALLEFLEKK